MDFYCKPDCLVKKINEFLCSRSRSQQTSKFQSVCPDKLFLTAELFITKLSKVMHHHEPEFLVKSCFAVFKVKVTVKAHTMKK